MIDWRGNTISLGDTVIYATRQGSYMGYVEGTVEGMYRKPTWRGQMEDKLTIKPIREGSHSWVRSSSSNRRSVTLKYVTKIG